MEEEVIEEAEIQIKYKGYIEREKFIAEKLHRLENIRIPADFDFHSMNSLTIEARQKLSRIRPKNIGQASRIPGVSPADVNVLWNYIPDCRIFSTDELRINTIGVRLFCRIRIYC